MRYSPSANVIPLPAREARGKYERDPSKPPHSASICGPAAGLQLMREEQSALDSGETSSSTHIMLK